MEQRYTNVRRALEELEEYRDRVNRLQRSVDFLQSKCTASTGSYSPRTGRTASGPSDLMDKLADRRTELEKRKQELARHQEQLEQWISALPRPRWRMVLRYHYLDGMDFVDVAEAMSQATGRNLSMHQIYRLHAQALQEADKRWPMH